MSHASSPPPTVCFLLGLPRSGTTLLAHLLQQHPDITAPPEPWLMLALEALGKVDYRHPADATFLGMATDEFLSRIDRSAACRALADAAYGQYLAAAGKSCFVDKTPRYWLTLDFIDALYPQAPQIILLRNPYAIAASLKSTWNVSLLPESCPPGQARYLADLVLGLPVLAARRGHEGTQIIRYETLVKEPTDEIRRAVAALGYDPASIGATTTENTEYLRSGTFGDRKILEKRTVDDRSVDAWRSELTPAEMQAVTDMIGAELLVDLGYEREYQNACSFGVIDRGEAITARHREVFRAWQTLCSGGKVAPAAPRAKTESSPSARDPAVLQEALRLAETETDLRLAKARAAELELHLSTSEADRAARLDLIHQQGKTITLLQTEVARLGHVLAAVEADGAARLDLIYQRDNTITLLQTEVARLDKAFTDADANRVAQLAVINDRDITINALKAEVEQAQNGIAESTNAQATILGSPWWRLGKRLNIVPAVELPPQKLRMFQSETPEVLAFHAASTARALQKIAARGLTISTVIDVGASNGMWSAVTRQSYPEARYFLIEAQKVHEADLISYCQATPKTDYILAAAGDSVGQIYFDDSAPFGGVASHQPTEAARTMLPVTTIDHEVSTRSLSGPFLVKLDTHGFEIPILKGAAETLKQANLVVIEVYNFKITDQSLLFDEMCAYMRTLGFGVIDISEPLWRQRDSALWQFDLFFIPLTRPEFTARTYT